MSAGESSTCTECGMTPPRHSLRCTLSAAPSAGPGAGPNPPADSPAAPPSGPATTPPPRKSQRLGPPPSTGKSGAGVVVAVQALLAQSRSDFLTFAGALTGATAIFVAGVAFFLHLVVGDSGPKVFAFTLAVTAFVFGVFNITLARDRVRGIVCFTVGLGLAALVCFLAFGSQFPVHSIRTFWIVSGLSFFAALPAPRPRTKAGRVGLRRRH